MYYTKHIIPATLLASALIVPPAHASLVTTGDLSYDNASNVITNTITGTSYLGWDQAASYNYAQTFAATNGGEYNAYHIATQTEAYAFFHASGGEGTDTNGKNVHSTSLPNIADGLNFGANFNASFDYAFFISDEQEEVGMLRTNSGDSAILIKDEAGTITDTDIYATSGSSNQHITWLLVSDERLNNVPEPTAVTLMGLGLLGLFGVNRRKV